MLMVFQSVKGRIDAIFRRSITKDRCDVQMLVPTGSFSTQDAAMMWFGSDV